MTIITFIGMGRDTMTMDMIIADIMHPGTTVRGMIVSGRTQRGNTIDFLIPFPPRKRGLVIQCKIRWCLPTMQRNGFRNAWGFLMWRKCRILLSRHIDLERASGRLSRRQRIWWRNWSKSMMKVLF